MIDKDNIYLNDLRVLYNSNYLSDFNIETINRFKEEIKIYNSNSYLIKLNYDQFLFQLGAITKENNLYYPTAGGLLLFGNAKAIKREFPSLFLEYKDYSEGINGQEEFFIGFNSNDNNWSRNLLDFFFESINRITIFFKDSKEDPNFIKLINNFKLLFVNAISKISFVSISSFTITKIYFQASIEYKPNTSDITNKLLLQIFNNIGLSENYEKNKNVFYVPKTDINLVETKSMLSMLF